MKLALIHDYLNQYGGAERVLQVLHSMFPDAPLYTTLYDQALTGGVFKQQEIRTSFLQRVPLGKYFHHSLSFLMPLAVEQFDVSSFDVALSVSSSFAKGIITKPTTRHICYCLTPPRFLWDNSQKFVQEFNYPWFVKALSPLLLSYLRVWDRQASERVDEYIAISQFVRERIAKYYGRDSVVIYPPVDVNKFTSDKQHATSDKGGYLLMVGRLVAYKKFDLAIRAANRLEIPLKIVGTGIEYERLRAIAGPTVEFLGLVNDEQLGNLYAKSRGLIFPQEEDFGIVPLEAMASGRPVIAYRGGGALETVVEGETGVFFDEQTEESLAGALNHFDTMSFDQMACRHQAEKFDIPVFIEKIKNFLATRT